MNRAILYFSLILLLIVIVGALRSVFERKRVFLRRFDDAKQAYLTLAALGAVLFIWSRFGNKLQIKSVEFAGVQAQVGNLEQKVTTLSEQMEAFFSSKKIQIFDRKNWNQVRVVSKSRGNIILEVTLDQEPIPNSLEIFEGVLLLPEQDYHVSGRKVAFLANSDKPVDGLTIKYYPRIKN